MKMLGGMLWRVKIFTMVCMENSPPWPPPPPPTLHPTPPHPNPVHPYTLKLCRVLSYNQIASILSEHSVWIMLLKQVFSTLCFSLNTFWSCPTKKCWKKGNKRHRRTTHYHCLMSFLFKCLRSFWTTTVIYSHQYKVKNPVRYLEHTEVQENT